MAFSTLMLTTSGKTLYAKAQQGKPLRFTRVAIGDGILGSGSMVNRTGLISERLSLLIDTIQLTNDSTEAAVIATLKNDTLTEGFYFREIAIFAEDPDTHQELAYLYDNAGADGEYLPDGQSGMRVAEHLKLLVKLENTPHMTFEASGNPLYLVAEDIADSSISTYALWSSQKISDELEGKVPTARKINGKALSADITLTALDVEARPDTWTPTAADVGAVPTARKINGKALTADITLTALDVKARPDTWTPTAADVGAVPTARKINGKALTADITLTAADVGAAKKGAKLSKTITTTWGGSAGAWTQVISVAGVTAASKVDVYLDPTATDAQEDAYVALQLRDGGQAAGSITLKAKGEKNTIAIPIIVVVGGDLS